MRELLWNSILQFDFDQPLSEYGFSTRLAKENYWTINFTQKAILEYKKFMYLASTSDQMVSPSEIVDVVWHQHLIFTQSYTDFCVVLGKSIQHVPSTHNREDYLKFSQAKERTNKLYTEVFGEQPEDIWNQRSMHDSLELPKAKYKLRSVIIVALLLFFVCSIPFYFILKPFYIHIENPQFVWSYIGMIVLGLIVLNTINRNYLERMLKSLNTYAFIHFLHPYELVYLKTGKLNEVIQDSINRFFEKGKIRANADQTLQLNVDVTLGSIEEYVIIDVLKNNNNIAYMALRKALSQRAVFSTIQNSMEALKKYLTKSEAFCRIFYINIGVFLILLMMGFMRIVIGVGRGKPVIIILIVFILSAIGIITFLYYLINLPGKRIIPDFYRKKVALNDHVSISPDWSYFLWGSAVLSSAFVPVVERTEKIERGSFDSGASSGDSSGGSDGSGCGSSCSSCGGCGGD